MRVLVTGAAGFIGSTLVDRLLDENHHVIGIDNFRTGSVANLATAIQHSEMSRGRFKLINLDVQAPELRGIVAGVSPGIIFHLAAQVDSRLSVNDPQFDARNNILGTINVCEAGRQAGVPRVVYATSPSRPDGADSPSPHEVAKRAGEMYLRAYSEMYPLTAMSLALGSVYGPRQSPCSPARVVVDLASAMFSGRPFSIPADSASAQDFVFVGDVVDALIHAGCAPDLAGGTYTVGTGRRTTLAQLNRLLAVVLDESAQPSGTSDAVDETFVATTYPDAGVPLPGWTPGVALDEGIARTVDWLRSISEVAPIPRPDCRPVEKAG